VIGKELLVAFFALGVVLLSWPFLTIFNQPRAVLGIPRLVLYLFAVWGVMIAVLLVVCRGEESDR
jgi:hypothetical protein